MEITIHLHVVGEDQLRYMLPHIRALRHIEAHGLPATEQDSRLSGPAITTCSEQDLEQLAERLSERLTGAIRR